MAYFQPFISAIVILAAVPETPAEKTLLNSAITSAVNRLKGIYNLTDIRAIPLNDEDRNYKIVLVTPKGEQPISLFALQSNGQPKTLDQLINELIQKITLDYSYRGKPGVITFPSGALLQPTPDVTLQNGVVTINGKKAVFLKDGVYQLLTGDRIQTYTIIKATKTNNLLVLTDDYDLVRKDGKEGFIYNLERPLKLTQSQTIPAAGEYYLLYRTKKEATEAPKTQ